jgi:hypothetical protein
MPDMLLAMAPPERELASKVAKAQRRNSLAGRVKELWMLLAEQKARN